MKLIWKEHKRTCERVEQAGSAVDALTEDLRELRVETEGQTRWWLKLQEQQKLIATYMDVVSLYRTDSAMTGMAGREEGVAEGAQGPGVCGAQQVASLQQHEQQGQVQGPAVEPAASHQAAGLPAGEDDVSRNAYATRGPLHCHLRFW